MTYPPGPHPPASTGIPLTAGGFFSGLFDFGFTRFISLKIISVVYILGIAAVSLFALILVVSGFTQGVGTGLLFLILAALGWVIYVSLIRIGLELYAVIFRIGDNTTQLLASSQRGYFAAPPAGSGYGSRGPGDVPGPGEPYPYPPGGGGGYPPPPPSGY